MSVRLPVSLLQMQIYIENSRNIQGDSCNGGVTFDEERHWHIGFHLRDRSRKILSKISGKCQR